MVASCVEDMTTDGAQLLGMQHVTGRARGWHDRDIQPPGAERRVGDVDDLVAGGVQGGDGGADRDSLSRSDIARDNPERGLQDAEADPGDGLGVPLAGEQVAGGDGLAERGAGQAEVRGPRRGAHRRCSPSWPSAVSAASRAKSIFAPVPAAWSWAAATRPR